MSGGFVPLPRGIVIGLGCCALLSGCGSDQPPVDSATPGLHDYVQGAEALDAGNQAEAQQQLSAAVAVNPNLTMAQILLGDIYRAENQYQLALPHDQAATHLDPYTAENFYHLGVSLEFLNRLEESAGAYLHALHLEPSETPARVNLGTVYIALGRTTDAVDILREATVRDPNSAAAWANLGIALDATSDLPGAEHAYKQSLECGGPQANTLLNLAANLIAQRKGPEAANVCRTLLASTDSAVAHKRFGDALVLCNQLDAAMAQYQLALARNPRYYEVMNQVGYLLIHRYEQGMELDESLRKQALADWRKSVAIAPDQPRVAMWIETWKNQPLGAGSKR
jgi:tetratricopeptide (TPR) repeat protein